MDFIEPCFGIGHNLSLICQMTSEDIKHQLIIIIFTHNYIHVFWFWQSEYAGIQISTKIKSAPANCPPWSSPFEYIILLRPTHRLTWPRLYFQTGSLLCWKNTQTDMNTWLYSEIIHQQTKLTTTHTVIVSITVKQDCFHPFCWLWQVL